MQREQIYNPTLVGCIQHLTHEVSNAHVRLKGPVPPQKGYSTILSTATERWSQERRPRAVPSLGYPSLYWSSLSKPRFAWPAQ